MPSNAAAVAVVISRSLILPSLMVSRPLSENIPCLVALVDIATNCSAFNPASFRYVGYSFTFSRNSSLAFAPATKPSCKSFSDSDTLMPNCLLITFADCKVSPKSTSNVSLIAKA